MSRIPTVAVVGRQNVGKSTLVNRLFGRREAIAHEMPGVTRDRVEIEVAWRGRTFSLVDTGGYAHGARGIEALVARQAERAAEQADAILFVVDGRSGIVEDDARFAKKLRRVTQPVLVAVNKIDDDRDELEVGAFLRLGLGEPLPVSALHGRGSGDLLDRLVALFPPAGEDDGADEDVIPRFALVGRSNVGKSSLFNLLVGDERSVVFEEAGTTRDAVDAVIRWGEAPVRFVDTAGLRRSARNQGVEYYSFIRTVRAIGRSDVAALVLDASEGFTTEDKRIAARVIEAGRGLLLVANKWDLVEEKDRTFKELGEITGPFAHATVLRTSAVRTTGIARLEPTLLDLDRRWRSRAPTSAVNEIIRAAQSDRPPPRGAGRFHYATQVSSGPPTFVLFGAKAPEAGYRRYLEGRLRTAFSFEGVPVRLQFRARRRTRASRGRPAP